MRTYVTRRWFILDFSGMEKVVMCALDYATPLQIQTSPAHSSSSTDTSSEIGSAFNSPTQGKGKERKRKEMYTRFTRNSSLSQYLAQSSSSAHSLTLTKYQSIWTTHSNRFDVFGPRYAVTNVIMRIRSGILDFTEFLTQSLFV